LPPAEGAIVDPLRPGENRSYVFATERLVDRPRFVSFVGWMDEDRIGQIDSARNDRRRVERSGAIHNDKRPCILNLSRHPQGQQRGALRR